MTDPSPTPAEPQPFTELEVQAAIRWLEGIIAKSRDRATDSTTDDERRFWRDDAAAHDRVRRMLSSLLEDQKRLDWLERQSNGYPVEVDGFTGFKDPSADRVFLTIYPCNWEGEPDAAGVAPTKSHRLGAGSTLRAAIDAARSPVQHQK